MKKQIRRERLEEERKLQENSKEELIQDNKNLKTKAPKQEKTKRTTRNTKTTNTKEVKKIVNKKETKSKKKEE